MTPTSEELQRILERVEGAEGGDLELDGDIAELFGLPPAEWKRGTNARWWNAAGGGPWDPPWDPPLFTTYMDAAVALVEKMLPAHPHADHKKSDIALRFGDWGANATIDRDTFHGGRKYEGIAATPALAICAALLRALIQKENGG